MPLTTIELHDAAARACQGTWPTAPNTDAITELGVYPTVWAGASSLFRRCRFALPDTSNVYTRTHHID